jgi:MFS family permease
MDPETSRHLKFNFTVNTIDGGFFGFGTGFASFVTIIPLFVSRMTDSAILIGLIPAIHAVGWQFPQLLIADRVTRQSRYRPMVLWMTIHERLPFLGLALVALLLPSIGSQAGLWLTFGLLIWQGLGGGFAASPWQSMIGKIIPSDRRGTFYGVQSAAAYLFASLSAILAGYILERFDSPLDFSLCFLLASLSLAMSWLFLFQTREPENVPVNPAPSFAVFWSGLGPILKRDKNFRWFLIVRFLSQFAVMGFALYTVYVVRYHAVSEIGVGIMTSVYLGTQIAVNPMMGWIGDHWSQRSLMQIGILASVLSALIAWLAPSAGWFYLVFILAGIANVAVWTLALAMILEFGSESDRPAYVGMANTLISPATILAPLLAGWLADHSGFPTAFLASAFGGLATLAVLQFLVRDPSQVARDSLELDYGD